MNGYNENRLIGIISEFFGISMDKIFPETELRRDLGATSGEVYLLVSESISDALNIAIIYEVPEVFTVQHILDVVKKAYSNPVDFACPDDDYLVDITR